MKVFLTFRLKFLQWAEHLVGQCRRFFSSDHTSQGYISHCFEEYRSLFTFKEYIWGLDYIIFIKKKKNLSTMQQKHSLKLIHS